MTDNATTLEDLTAAVIEFRDARDWKQYHNAKDVSISLSLEASELLEIFQWSPSPITPDFIQGKRPHLQEELADVFYWVLLMSYDLNIDLASALRSKLKLNEQKYPVALARGKSTKYDAFETSEDDEQR